MHTRRLLSAPPRVRLRALTTTTAAAQHSYNPLHNSLDDKEMVRWQRLPSAARLTMAPLQAQLAKVFRKYACPWPTSVSTLLTNAG